MEMQIALIAIAGFMGSGKSTIAQALALRLDLQMIDLDREILKQEERSARQIIEEDGEVVFREIETRVLGDVIQNNSSGVIALGGGAWTLTRNQELLGAAGGVSVWLDAPFNLCWQRIVTGDNERPLAQNRQEALDRYTERRAAYATADLHIEATANKTPDGLALEIVKALAGR